MGRLVVLIPLCNPHGYARNWRYLNTSKYSEEIEGQSFGDSSHLFPEPKDPKTPRAAEDVPLARRTAANLALLQRLAGLAAPQ